MDIVSLHVRGKSDAIFCTIDTSAPLLHSTSHLLC